MSAAPFLIEVAIEPAAGGDIKTVLTVLSQLAADDASFGFTFNEESGQIILKGMSEGQLGTAVTSIKRDAKILVRQPRVSYREMLTKKVQVHYTHKKQTHGAGQFAKVDIIFEPTEAGAGSSFESRIVGGTPPEEYIPAVEKGVNSVMGTGVVAGFPVINVKATLVDGAHHETDSSPEAFEIAARAAFREALQKGGSVAEPIMKVAVGTKEEHLGFVIGDLKSRRGEIQESERRDDEIVVRALVPFSNLLSYQNNLAAGTRNTGWFTMQFSHYAAVNPPDGPDDDPFAPAMAVRIRAA